jgi:hypothetical protein
MDLFSNALPMSKTNNKVISEALFESIHSETNFEKNDKSKLQRNFDKWRAVLTADYSQCRTMCSPEIMCALTISMNESLNRYHKERCRAIAGKRKIFVTSKGHFGAGPISMEIGDQVALLSGLTMPLILREAAPHYEVVGEAYVHGAMQGELWPENESHLLQLTLK